MTRPAPDLAAALRDAIGEGQLLFAAPDLAGYDQDGRGPGGAALLVARPRSADEVAAVLRIAHAHGVAVVPQGARSGLAGAGLADGSVVLSLERVAGPPRIDAENRTAEVDAGVPLSALNAAAAEHGLTFPIDLGADPTIGGMIAANTGGARFLRHGDVRRSLLALEVVLADGQGTQMRLGNPVWKDNSGLELKQLFASSAGALGVVTRATVALQPLPANSVCALVALAEPAEALALLLALERRAGTLLSAFEGISGTALDLALSHVPRLKPPFAGGSPPYCALVELSAGDAIPADLLMDILGEAITPMIEDGRATDAVIDEGRSLWAVRHAIPEGLRTAGAVIACDIAVRRGDLMRFREEAAAAVSARWPELVIADFGHCGDGGLHFNMVWPRALGPIPAGLAEEVRRLVFAMVVDGYHGSFSAEHGIGPRNIDHYVRFTPEPVRALAGRVQRLIAPAGIGRVDFGAGAEDGSPA
ncbi:FAD-binding oxidoreductase [Sphingomonas canadensis]|uniref:FAD-binding oxidoreductase n=1 Tax=Sphingomonas canadensis TaxID=1219257 RepID=A0ABW3HA77_9SPHN|nr:FAD-binding oxidoreductase [Sphingomonas canadensis]MCW3837656.1 FAD-binding oxidoreductase [Sphingomonas canadensis]